MRNKIIILILLCLLSVYGFSQAPAPSGFASPYSTGYYRIGWLQSDSGSIPAYRDTNWIPKFQGTFILWQHAGSDTALWYRLGNRWVKILKQGDVVGGVTSFNTRTGAITLNSTDITNALGFPAIGLASLSATSPIVYNNLTGVFSCPTCGIGGGISSLNGLTNATQTFSTGTSGTDFGISSVGSVHTFNLPTASASNRGLLSTSDWSIFNSKQPQLNGTGFVKATGTTISYDNTSYYPASNPNNYIALTALSALSPIFYNNLTGAISADTSAGNTHLATQAYVLNHQSSGTITGAGNLSPLFTTSIVSNTIVFSLSNAGANSILGNNTGSTGPPSYFVPNSTTISNWLGFVPEPSITASNTIKQYWNGYKQFVTLNTDSVNEGSTNLFFTNARARSAISLTTTGTSGAATYNNSTGVLNIPNYAVTSGTVTSVALSTPSFLTTTGSPITTSGTFTVTLATQAANTVFGNHTGSTAAPTFGKVVLADQANNTPGYIQGWDPSTGVPTALPPDTLFVKNRVSGTGVQLGNISNDTLYLNNLVAGANITLTKNADSSITIAGTGGGGSGTVTQFNFTNGGGINGNVTNATTTPTLSLTPSFTGLVQATSGSAFSAATINAPVTFSGGALGVDTSHGVNSLATYADLRDSTNGIRYAARWPAEAPLGTVYTKFGSGNNLNDIQVNAPGITAVNTGGFYTITPGTINWSNTIGFNPAHLMMINRWTLKLTWVVKGVTSGSIGIGPAAITVQSANVLNGIECYSNGTTGGSGALNIVAEGGSPTLATGTGHQWHVGDSIDQSLILRDTIITFKVKNWTTGFTDSVNYTFVLGTRSPPSTSMMGMVGHGDGTGSYQLQNVVITSDYNRNATVGILGSSKWQGFRADNWHGRMADSLNRLGYDVVLYAEGNGRYVDVINRLEELRALNCTQWILAEPCNDLRSGFETLQQAFINYKYVHDVLASGGAKIFNCVLPEDSTAGGTPGVALTAWNALVKATWPNEYIDTYDTLSTVTPNVLNSAYQADKIHPNQAGNNAEVRAIIASGKLGLPNPNRLQFWRASDPNILMIGDSINGVPQEHKIGYVANYAYKGWRTGVLQDNGTASGVSTLPFNQLSTSAFTVNGFMGITPQTSGGSSGLLFGDKNSPTDGTFVFLAENRRMDLFNNHSGKIDFSVDSIGRMALGQDITGPGPSAYLTLNKGKASVGNAPLKFSLFQATLLTIPEKGAEETDSIGRRFHTDSTGTRHQYADLNGYNNTQSFGGTQDFTGANTVFASQVSSNAGLKLNSGTLLGTTQAGALENDGTHLYFTFANAGTRFQLDQQGSTNIYNADGTLTGNRTMDGSASNFFLKLGNGTGNRLGSLQVYTNNDIILSSASGYTSVSGGMKNHLIVSGDASFTADNTYYFTELSVVTANRTITLPAPGVGTTGQTLIFINTNTSGTFHWSFGSGVIDPTGASITTLTNGITYQLVCDGTNWMKYN